MGLHTRDDNSIIYREWAPNAVHAALIGDFSTYGHNMRGS